MQDAITTVTHKHTDTRKGAANKTVEKNDLFICRSPSQPRKSD